MSVPDWIGSPADWKGWGLRANGWFNELVADLRGTLDIANAATAANAATQADLDALEVSTAALSDGTGGIAFTTNVANYGAGYQGLEVYESRAGMVYVSGLIQNNTGGSIADGGQIFQLPTGWRPASIVLASGIRGAGHSRLDINSSGQCTIKQFAWPNADFLWVQGTFKSS